MATEKVTVKLPDGFDARVHLTKLERMIADKYGEGFEIDVIDPVNRTAVATRHVNITSVSAAVGATGDLREVNLPKGTKPSDGERLAAKLSEEYPDHAMVKFEPFLRRAILAPMDAATRRARDAISVALSVKPWDVGVEPRPDGGYDVILPRTYVPSKHDDKLDEVATAVIGREGWYVDANAQTLKASFIPADPPTFPPAIKHPLKGGDGTLIMANDKWANVPIGMTLARPGDDVGHSTRSEPLCHSARAHQWHHQLRQGSRDHGALVWCALQRMGNLDRRRRKGRSRLRRLRAVRPHVRMGR